METGNDERITGWEMANPAPELFKTKILRVSGGCQGCVHLDDCEAPHNSLRELVPIEGELTRLGTQTDAEGDELSYFALRTPSALRLLRVARPNGFWATAEFVGEEELSPSALERLREFRGREGSVVE